MVLGAFSGFQQLPESGDRRQCKEELKNVLSVVYIFWVFNLKNKREVRTYVRRERNENRKKKSKVR